MRGEVYWQVVLQEHWFNNEGKNISFIVQAHWNSLGSRRVKQIENCTAGTSKPSVFCITLAAFLN